MTVKMIKHVMADGRQVDNVDGFLIPTSGNHIAVYRIIQKIYMESIEATGDTIITSRGNGCNEIAGIIKQIH
jgi:hypothetical protein